MKNLHDYLDWYSHIQNNILVCYRANEHSSWSNRCFYDSVKYDKNKSYTHRSILTNEIVLEYDFENKNMNKLLVNMVSKRLLKDGIAHSIWYSGNKSYHVHVIVSLDNIMDKPLFKSCFIKYYGKFYMVDNFITESGEGTKILPDLRLASENHLIRAEFGNHEKTGNKKELIESYNYPSFASIPQEVYNYYVNTISKNIKMKMTNELKGSILEDEKFKYLLQSEKIRISDDGRERAMFAIIHVLKPKYKENKEGFIKFLTEWYRYAGGVKMSEHNIRSKVEYHWNKTYHIGHRYLEELLDSINANLEVKKMQTEIIQEGV